MTLCSNCNDNEKIRAVRSERFRTPSGPGETKSFSPNHGPGWHRESYWHAEASRGNKIPKIR